MRRLTLLLLVSAAFADDPAIDVATIIPKIRSGSPSECVEAVGKLPPGKEERAAKPIAIRLVTEADAQARAVLREALAAYKGAVLVQAVKTGLETKGVTDDYRQMALDLLGKEKNDTAVTLVGKIAFESEMKAMRESGQKTLVAFGDDGVKSAATYIRSADQKIASEAVQVLKAFNSEEAGKALA
ncbi:MAG: hypothetical protein K8T20_07870, partial [Planctomycetes bacterium]|nr:hypothetical protein [Planctomycetota bacterium]